MKADNLMQGGFPIRAGLAIRTSTLGIRESKTIWKRPAAGFSEDVASCTPASSGEGLYGLYPACCKEHLYRYGQCVQWMIVVSLRVESHFGQEFRSLLPLVRFSSTQAVMFLKLGSLWRS